MRHSTPPTATTAATVRPEVAHRAQDRDHLPARLVGTTGNRAPWPGNRPGHARGRVPADHRPRAPGLSSDADSGHRNLAACGSQQQTASALPRGGRHRRGLSWRPARRRLAVLHPASPNRRRHRPADRSVGDRPGRAGRDPRQRPRVPGHHRDLRGRRGAQADLGDPHHPHRVHPRRGHPPHRHGDGHLRRLPRRRWRPRRPHPTRRRPHGGRPRHGAGHRHRAQRRVRHRRAHRHPPRRQTPSTVPSASPSTCSPAPCSRPAPR